VGPIDATIGRDRRALSDPNAGEPLWIGEAPTMAAMTATAAAAGVR
jgi:hypothetical protein